MKLENKLEREVFEIRHENFEFPERFLPPFGGGVYETIDSVFVEGEMDDVRETVEHLAKVQHGDLRFKWGDFEHYRQVDSKTLEILEGWNTPRIRYSIDTHTVYSLEKEKSDHV